MKVLVTGAKGFVGKNLVAMLGRQPDIEITGYDLDDPPSVLADGLATADLVFHLAGVNRPEKPEDYATGNTGFTERICETLLTLRRTPVVIFSSSIQATLDNAYGISKLKAEEALIRFADKSGARVVIFRMKNVFGKWCRPNYNSGVATFCHNIARNLPITISDRANEVNLVYVDDVCQAMMEAAGILQPPFKHFAQATGSFYAEIAPSFKMTLGEIVDLIYKFKDSRVSLQVPEFNDAFIYRLYATYLSYLEEANFAYGLDIKTDNRGCLAEFLKSSSFGQIFISRTKPGITRGNHYHHTKTEKFLVVQGEAVVRFRKIMLKDRDQRSEGRGQKSEDRGQRAEDRGQRTEVRDQRSEDREQRTESRGQRTDVRCQEAEVIEYRVNGEDFRVVDIPPGYTHSIENVGNGELVTLFWANQIFNPDEPDTYFEVVM